MTKIVILNAGPVHAEYQDGSLRYVRVGKCELLRQVYVAVRGEGWKTIPARIRNEEISQSKDGFRIQLAVDHTAGDVDFAWTGEIAGNSDGSLRWTMSGEPRKPFLRNRIGFCILHPIRECAGRPCTVEHSGGALEQTRFPALISPAQPFLDVRAISYETSTGLKVRVSANGDVFETEDHRNWTDYSFKTYSTPLARPHPVLVSRGDRVEQSVGLELAGDVIAPGPCEDQPVTIEVSRSKTYPMPQLGCFLLDAPATALDYARVDVNLDKPAWKSEFAAARACNVPIEFAVFTKGAASDFEKLRDELTGFGTRVRRILLFAPDGAATERSTVLAARKYFTGHRLGGGANTNFTELNRNRAAVDVLDFVSWGINPRVHATDDLTMVENIEGQAATVESAKTFSGNRALAISPVRIPPFAGGRAWVIGSISELAQAGASSITYDPCDSALHDVVRSAPARVLATRSSDPLKAGALAVVSQGRSIIFLANYGKETQSVICEGRSFRLGPYQVLKAEAG
jgi:hypothetical protein